MSQLSGVIAANSGGDRVFQNGDRMQSTVIKEGKISESVDCRETAESLLCPLCRGTQIAKFLNAPDRFHWRRDVYSLCRCGTCSCVWLNDPPKPEEMGLHYTEDYHKGIMAAGEGSVTSRWRYPRERIAAHKQGGTILDIGCSSGGFLSTMKGPAWQLYGVEIEESTAQRARVNTGASVFVGDAVAAPFLAASFDVITSFDVLEHVYSPRQFLTKVLEWLKPGGIYYAAMPNIDSWEARLFGTHWYGLELPRHLFHFSPRSLRWLMTDLGFEELSIATPRVSYIERSTGYLYSSMIEKMGCSPTPQAQARSRSLARRALRKGIYLGCVGPLAQVASLAGAGPSMEVIFKKPSATPHN
jgi:SAM-dependent methyltransferase